MDDVEVPRWRRIAPEHREMGLVGGTLFCSGGLLVVVDLLTPPDGYTAKGWVLAVAVSALVAGAFYLWSADHLPMPIWGYAIGTTAGAVMVTVLVLAGGPQRTGTFGVLYVFVSTYGFYYYGPAISWWLVGLNGVGFALALAYHDVPGAVGEWAVVVGTAAIAGGLIGSLSQRVRRLLAAERENVAALHELDAWRTTFLRAVAHDLRAPLATLLGFVATVRDHGEDMDEEQRHLLLERAAVGGERLRLVLTDLLDLERIEAGALEPALEESRLDELVRSSLEDLDLTVRDVHVELEPVTAVVEPAKVDRIVTNLVRNALKHTRGDASVWVRLGVDGGTARLVVEDDGDGIEPEVRAGLFEAFSGNGNGAQGTGLGLHLVRRFTELHDGRVEATDRPGGGARFVVQLPLSGPPVGREDAH